MWKRILLIGALLACVSSFTRSVRHETRAEDEPLAPAVRSNRNATEEPVLDEAYTDCGLAARVAILLQEEIGWNEFGADHVIDPEIQKMTRHTIFERQRLLRNIRSFAPDATRNGYVNTNAKDARDIAAPIASAQPGRSLSHSSAMKNGKHQEPEVDRLARFTPLDRASAWAAAMASYRGAVAAALRKNAGLQSPMINPPSDNLITNPAGILPGNSEGGSLNPPVVGIQAPGANSAAAIGVGGLGQVAAGTGVGSNAAVGAGSLGGINPTATGTARSASTGGLLSGPAAGANVQAGRNLGNSPSGLLSGPASGVQGPQAGTTSSKNPTGLLSGPAAGVNTNSAVGAAANGPTGLLSGPGAGVQGPQSGTTASTNPTGLLSGPAAGANTNSTVGAAANGPTGLLSGPGAGVQGPQSGTTASKNPTGLLSGPAAGTQGPQSGNTSSKNPTGLLSGPAAGKTSQNGGTGNTGAATANGPTTDQSATTQATGATVDSNGNVIPAIGIVGDGGVAAGETQAFLPDGNGIANSGVPPTNTVTGGFTPGTGRGASQRHGQISNGGVSVQETGKGRTRIMNARDSANHDFDVMQVERQLAVQSLAGSKRLIEQKTGQEIDLAFLRQEMVMQHELLDKLVVYQKYASSDLKEVLVDAERVLITNLADTQRLIEHRLPTARVSARRSGQD